MLAVAWADDHLFAEYSNDLIRDGENWKIHLGRRIYLHQNDPDGSLFIEELLEEIMNAPRSDQWETVKEGDTWVTRPVLAAISLNANGDDDGSHHRSNGHRPYSGRSSSDTVAKLNPLLVEDDYAIDESDAADELKEDDVEDNDTDTSSTDWEAHHRNEQEKKRKSIVNDSAEDQVGGEGGADDNDDSNFSSEPGSDWDSNDGIP